MDFNFDHSSVCPFLDRLWSEALASFFAPCLSFCVHISEVVVFFLFSEAFELVAVQDFLLSVLLLSFVVFGLLPSLSLICFVPLAAVDTF